MARKIDWAPTQQLFKQYSSFFLQDELSKRRSTRSLDYLRQQMAAYERLDVLQDEMRRAAAGEKHELDKELAIAKTLLDIRKDPTADSYLAEEKVLLGEGRVDEAQAARAKWDALAQEYSKANVKILKEEGLENQEVQDILEAAGIPETGRQLRALGTGMRSKRSTELAKDTARTTKERLEFDIEKEERKIGEEAGLPSKREAGTLSFFKAREKEIMSRLGDVDFELTDEQEADLRAELQEIMGKIDAAGDVVSTRLGEKTATGLGREVTVDIGEQKRELQALFDEVVAILVQNGLTPEEARARALAAPEFAGLAEPLVGLTEDISPKQLKKEVRQVKKISKVIK